MAYVVTHNKHSYTVAVEESGSQSQQVLVDTVPHSIVWQQLLPLFTQSLTGGRYHLLLNHRSYEIFARRLQSVDAPLEQRYEILLAGQRFEVLVEDERIRQLANVSRSQASQSARVQAPMPGLVVKLLVDVGTAVHAGQTVAVLEAMKMENDLTSPISGIVHELRVQTGQTVEQGQLLVSITAQAAHNN
ncbi:biotin/lipoyl-containing protein [Tengunoibacter tsumagoiensis]|uniref:Lipoyl-binding domain-containing protein n=1 Tax=Tengunoibacter tsumagoiensis TaxID=2014871 RepID=A0A402A4G9_9CHLR|nr:acetyl-CoA carboxylase biotin carboxyl carrier protein subunit [Tengunoibacter tsumagoiensis]GCE14054.1 hypothetical protein KTT_39130 [Tengunoibacter tsumagoiensis]